MDASASPNAAVEGVLAVLAGAPLEQAAERWGLAAADLADAVEVYRAAGEAALNATPLDSRWYQVHIEFPDWADSEQTGAHHLAPRLHRLAPAIESWWFIRKAPCWRIRCRSVLGAALADTRGAVTEVLNGLAAAGRVSRWWETVYEPEALAFGGALGMETAHTLFASDSSAVLDHVRRESGAAGTDSAIGRRELSILLCSALFRGAGQEWHEQGDVWHRVTRLRPLPAGTPTDRLHRLAADLHRLTTVDTGPAGSNTAGAHPLSFVAPWATAFTIAGESLGRAAHEGTLERGLRDVLAHHVIFHWNRLGLPGRTQAILARAACDMVMSPLDTTSGDDSRAT